MSVRMVTNILKSLHMPEVKAELKFYLFTDDAECVSGLSVTHHRQEAHQWEQKKDIVQQIKDNDWSPESTPTSFSCSGYVLGNDQYNLRTVTTVEIRE